MKNKDHKFNEKLCITASSQDHAHREPVSFVVRRGGIIIFTVMLVCIFALCTYIAVNAMLTLSELKGTNEALKQTAEMQNSAREQFEQKSSEMQQEQQRGGAG